MPEQQRREAILDALRATKGDVAGSARVLGVHRQNVWHHMWRLGIAKEPARMRAAARRRFVLPPETA